MNFHHKTVCLALVLALLLPADPNSSGRVSLICTKVTLVLLGRMVLPEDRHTRWSLFGRSCHGIFSSVLWRSNFIASSRHLFWGTAMFCSSSLKIERTTWCKNVPQAKPTLSLKGLGGKFTGTAKQTQRRKSVTSLAHHTVSRKSHVLDGFGQCR